MPNELKRITAILAMSALLALGGCATTPASTDILLEADDAIALAQRADALDHAPLELDEALKLREEAADRIEADEADEAARLTERAAKQARLAIVRAEGSRARSELERKRIELERLRNELRQAFGAAIDGGDES